MQSRTELRKAQRELRILQEDAPRVIYPDYVRVWVSRLDTERERAEEAFMCSISRPKVLPKDVRKLLNGSSLSLVRIYIKDQIQNRPSITEKGDYIGNFVRNSTPELREWIDGKIAEYKSIEEAHNLEYMEIPPEIQQWADWRTKQLGNDLNIMDLSDLDLVSFIIGNY